MSPAHRHTHSSINSISIASASAATPSGFLQVVVSKARKHAKLARPLLPRASDTTLGLLARFDLIHIDEYAVYQALALSQIAD